MTERTTTHEQDFAINPDYRLVATFPLSGRRSDAYTVWIVNEGPSELYAVCDHYGFNFAATRTFGEALDLCLRNGGWAWRTRPATERDYA